MDFDIDKTMANAREAVEVMKDWGYNPQYVMRQFPHILEGIESFLLQYGCRCGHPHCRQCAATQDLHELLHGKKQAS